MTKYYELGEPNYTVPPGETLRDELRAHRLSVKKFAGLTDISEETVRGILCGHEAITPLIAEKFERVLELPTAKVWMLFEDGYQEGVRLGRHISSRAYWREESRRRKAAGGVAHSVHRQVAVAR